MKVTHLPKKSLFTALLSGFMPLFMSQAEAAVIDLSKPVGQSISPSGVYWSFDEGEVGASSPNATDHSGNGLHGTLSPSSGNIYPTYAEGRFGGGVAIQGNSTANRDPNILWDGRSADLDASAIDFAGKSFTAGIWMKLDDINTGANQTIFLIERGLSVYPGNTGTQRNFFSFRLNKWSNDTWSMNLMLGDGIQQSVNITSSVNFNSPNDLDWHHFAFSLEVVEGGSQILFYLDGEQFGNAEFANMHLPAITKASEKELRVGERNSSQYQSAFNGTVDDFFITEGAHTFMIPEPSAVALLLPLAGLGLLTLRGRTKK